MAMMKNECVQCGDKWEFDGSKAQLEEIDELMLQEFGTLYSLCEDCNNGICETVEPLIKKAEAN